VGEAILKYLLALALYLRHGFQTGAPFADDAASPRNQFLHLELRD
jgi:hypothetical protein